MNNQELYKLVMRALTDIKSTPIDMNDEFNKKLRLRLNELLSHMTENVWPSPQEQHKRKKK